jgi:ribonuclease G
VNGYEIFIESEPWEERVAVREGGVLAEYFLERPGESLRVGSVYAGRVMAMLNGVRAALVDIGTGEPAFLPLREPETAELAPAARGQTVLVQVIKRPLNGKRAQVTRMVSLPGRLAVLTPGLGGVKVSRRIEDQREKERLESVLKSCLAPGCGLLARTAAALRTEDEIRSDCGRLIAEWNALEARLKDAPVPSCLREEAPLRVRALRDLCGSSPERIRISPPAVCEGMRPVMRERFPGLEDVLAPEESGLFWRAGLETELEQTLDRRVWLRGGGSLVIDSAEAMTVVDVNSGSPAEEGSPEEVALRTNLEAAQEVPRQLRLRGIGGIIVVDFIDMVDTSRWKSVMEVLESSLRRDRVKTQVASPSQFGVVEMTRKRVDETTHQHLTEPCPVCGGRGRTLSPASVAILAARKVMRTLKSGGKPPVTVRVHPRVGTHLREDSRLLTAINADFGGGAIRISEDPGLAIEDFRVGTS